MNTKLGFVSLLLTSFLFSSYGIFSRILNKELTVLQQLSYRYALGLIFVLIIFFLIKKQKLNIKKYFKKEVLFYGILIAISFYLFIQSFIVSKLSVSISGFYAGTILSALLIGYLVLKEKLNPKGVVGLIIILMSFAFLNDLNFTQIINLGLILGFISGVCYGINNFMKKTLTNFTKEDFLLIISFFIFIIMQTVSFATGEKLVTNLSLESILTLVGFISVALAAEYLTILGFRNFNLYLGSIVLSMEIFFTVIVGYLFFKEIPTTYEWIGILMVFAAVVITNLPERKVKITSKK